MLPASIAASTGPINIFINTNFATSLGEGVVTWLNYSFRLLQLPVGVFGVAIGVAVLPPLTRSIKKGEGKITKEVSDTFSKSFDSVLWIMGACSLFLYSEAYLIIKLLFGYGRFSEADVYATAEALKYYSFAAIGYGLIKITTSFYYALNQTKFAMYVSIMTVFVNFISNYFFSKVLGYTGLALTTSLTLTLNSIVLLIIAIKLGIKLSVFKHLKSLCLLVMSITCSYLFINMVKPYLAIDSLPDRLEYFFSLTISGLILLSVFLFFCSFKFWSEKY